ncbi:TBC1 domain family member 1 isoform X2 [Antennarius striatus]|uniref:TBC1 domain family member 1 isoform X2 n=1 Tax=Antennarius striatus TaxID=241820 RepID=UPI0035AEE7CB
MQLPTATPAMEGLYFEVKPRGFNPPRPGRSDKTCTNITLNHTSSTKYSKKDISSCEGVAGKEGGETEVEEVQYELALIGSLSVHHLTTMAMLPWIVAEISKFQPIQKRLGAGLWRGCPNSAPKDLSTCHQTVFLYVSASWVQCVSVLGDTAVWDPLTHTVLFECHPHQVTKLIHNSQEPSSFGCLVRTASNCTCYVFQCQDTTKVPEIISTLRQAGKSFARKDEITIIPRKASGDTDPSEKGFSSHSTSTVTSSDVVSPTAFAKKFEVLFCGRVSVAHKKAPPALIDECIEKFSQLHKSGRGHEAENSDTSVCGVRRALTFSSNGLDGDSASNPASEKHPVLFKKDSSFSCLLALDENGLSPEISHTNISDIHAQLPGVQPTSLQENRTMLFTVGKSQIFLVSPDTKKVAIEKSFKEISFCSQGIRHVDHFGFICRETTEGGSCCFVCYVFQCTDESLVDEIMLTLKQAFSVAAVQQNAKTQGQQCDRCPMHQLHSLCERIDGLHPSKTKLELQKHLATLDNQEQASVFEKSTKPNLKSDQEENELMMASLRNLYEERQKNHQHTFVCEEAARVEVQQQSSSRQRLEQFKSRAKRSLTESLEGIWRGSSKARAQRDSSSSLLTDKNSHNQSRLDDPLSDHIQLQPTSPLRGHNSAGDLKCLDGSLSFPSSSSLGDAPLQGLRRRANTFSHPPTPSSSECSPVLTRNYSPQDTTTATKAKLVRHYSVSTDTPHQSNDVASLFTPNAACGIGENALCNHRHSWRQQIFLRVATPQKNTESNEQRNPCLEGVGVCVGQMRAGRSGDLSIAVLPQERKKRNKEELKELWRKAIMQQILLQRMERENQKLQASESNLQNKRLKLDYEEITPCLKDVTLVWEKMLGTPGRAKVKFDAETIHAAVAHGVPRQHRGEIWKLLSEQYLLKQTVPSRPPTSHTPYKELLKQLTTHQHAILIDLGRTFPTHPYFQTQLGAGQLSLYNLLKAYSLLDPEVGYCQGLSFIAGVLLLHMGEEDAFNMLKFLMYEMGLRKQYRPDMIILQIQMYQLSRLLHDYHRDLYTHLEQQEIGPSLYATPWFLTTFASHFPLGFVARVFDMLFLQGSEVIFKVALSLLGSHKPLILQHESLESIVDFIKTALPKLGLVQMEKTINQVCEMDVSKQLQAYEVEYHVLQDELLDLPPTLNQHQRAAQLERTNQSLRQQNLDLLEELQVSHARVCGLENRMEALVQSENQLREQVSVLEEEKKELVSTVAHLQDLLSSFGIHTTPDGATRFGKHISQP